ncbi:MAG: hypothetical protein ACFE89_00805 [Candidatus Hodarchaeota archaeon]
MQRKTFIILGIIALVITLDVIWAILNYMIPYFLGIPLDLVYWIPGGIITDWIIIFYLIPVLAIGFYIMMGFFAPRRIVLPLNRILNPGPEVYYYGLSTKEPRQLTSIARRAVFALIITLGLSLTIANYFGPFIIIYEPSLPLTANVWNAAAVITPIVFLVLGLILSPSWLIDDANIIFHSQPPSGAQELMSASRVLLYLLAGYASISVIIDYAGLVANIGLIYLSAGFLAPPWVPSWFFVLITLINPIIFIYIPLLALLGYQQYLPTLQKHLKAHMDARGTQQISEMVVVDVDISDYLGTEEKPQ